VIYNPNSVVLSVCLYHHPCHLLLGWQTMPSWYSLQRLYVQLTRRPAKEIFVALDSCFSGASGRSVLAKGARPLVMISPSALVSTGNITFMAAAAGSQISSTYEEKSHGLFCLLYA